VKPRWTSCLGEDVQLRPVAKTSFQEGDMVEIGWTGDGAKVSKACTPSVHIKIAGIYISTHSHMILFTRFSQKVNRMLMVSLLAGVSDVDKT
jgi:hypothetical protein